MSTLLTAAQRLRRLAEPHTLPTTREAFFLAMRALALPRNARLADTIHGPSGAMPELDAPNDPEDQALDPFGELWERVSNGHTLGSPWEMAYREASQDVFDATLDAATTLNLAPALATQLAQQMQADYDAWVSNHTSEPSTAPAGETS